MTQRVTETDSPEITPADLDKTGLQFLGILHGDGRASYNEIGERLGIFSNTVRRRMDDMREQGVIEKFACSPIRLFSIT